MGKKRNEFDIGLMKNDVQNMEFFLLVFLYLICIYEGGSITLQQLVFDLKFSWYNV